VTAPDFQLPPPPEPPPTTRLWVDAYTMQLEGIAEAIASPKVRGAAADALRQAQAALAVEVNEEKAEQLRSVIANQQQVLMEIGTFNVEAYRDLMARWRSVREQILRQGWDLTQDLDFERDDATGFVNICQGRGKPQPFMAAEAQVALAFINFVNTNQEKFDPLSYTKKILLAQGINADNFDDHADRLCITNPWAPSKPAKPKIIQGNFRP
jgi:hypothetical protein